MEPDDNLLDAPDVDSGFEMEEIEESPEYKRLRPALDRLTGAQCVGFAMNCVRELQEILGFGTEVDMVVDDALEPASQFLSRDLQHADELLRKQAGAAAVEVIQVLTRVRATLYAAESTARLVSFAQENSDGTVRRYAAVTAIYAKEAARASGCTEVSDRIDRIVAQLVSHVGSAKGDQDQNQQRRESEFKSLLGSMLSSAEQLPPGAEETIEADLRLQFDYPNERVVYIDTWNSLEGKPRLDREVLFNSNSQVETADFISGLPSEKRAKVQVELQPDPLVGHLSFVDLRNDE